MAEAVAASWLIDLRGVVAKGTLARSNLSRAANK